MTSRNHPDQLNLFTVSQVPERFRLDDATKRRGMRHVAELKALLEARYPSVPRSADTGTDRPRRPLGARAARRAA